MLSHGKNTYNVRMKQFCIFLLIPFLLINVFKIFNIHLNYTESMPIGFYQKIHVAKIKDGDLTAVCLPDAIAIVGLKNHYLARGSCTNGSTPVLKKIIAVPGDNVLLTNQFIRVNKIIYYAPSQKKDPEKHWVKKFINNGEYKHIHSYWLYGSNDPTYSWDSRYYGGVKRANIIGTYKPLFTL